jgi:hypothetical protein
MDPSQLSATGRKHLPLIELDANEQLVYEIRKHPIGLGGVYLSGFLAAGGLFGGSLALAYALNNTSTDAGSLRVLVLFLGGFLSILALIITAVSAYLYDSNVVFVTSEKIAQVLYRTIFDRKISQLSIGDVQDVTTSQRGLFARMFNYGTLIIETSGEQANYTFTFTPRPYEAAKAIVSAHEENLKLYGN